MATVGDIRRSGRGFAQAQLAVSIVPAVDEGNGVTNTFPVEEIHDMQPHVAYRTAASADGSIWMLHQLATNNEIAIENDEDSTQAEASPWCPSAPRPWPKRV